MAANKHDMQTARRAPDLSRPEERFEHRDVNAWAVYKFGIALALLVRPLDRRCCSGCIATFVSSAKAARCRTSRSMWMRARLPPMPRLQSAPITDLKDMRAAEDQILSGYGWVDQQHGVVRIPIDRAIDLLAQRGLPARPQNEPQSARRGRERADRERPRAQDAAARRAAGRRTEVKRTFVDMLALRRVGRAFAQPGQPAPALASRSMQDSNLKTQLPGALAGRRDRSEARSAGSARTDLPRRIRPRRAALDVLPREEAGGAGAGLLPLPDAVHADSERAWRAVSRSCRSTPGRISKSSASASIPRTRREIAAGKEADRT